MTDHYTPRHDTFDLADLTARINASDQRWETLTRVLRDTTLVLAGAVTAVTALILLAGL